MDLSSSRLSYSPTDIDIVSHPSQNPYPSALGYVDTQTIYNSYPTNIESKSSGQSLLDINYHRSSLPGYKPTDSFNISMGNKNYTTAMAQSESSVCSSMDTMRSSDINPNADMTSTCIINRMVIQSHSPAYMENQPSHGNCNYDQWHSVQYMANMGYPPLPSWTNSDMPTTTNIATINANVSVPYNIHTQSISCMDYPLLQEAHSDNFIENSQLSRAYQTNSYSSMEVQSYCDQAMEINLMPGQIAEREFAPNPEYSQSSCVLMDEDASSVSSSSSSNSSDHHQGPMQPNSQSTAIQWDTKKTVLTDHSMQLVDSKNIYVKVEPDIVMARHQSPTANKSLFRHLSREQLIQRVVQLEKEKQLSSRLPDCDASPQESPPLDNSDEEEIHTCRWSHCNMTTLSLDQLIVHIKDMHIGSGKAAYYCEWVGCPREQKPFLKRHKMQNHMRTHTGERPFTCKVEGCDKKFSRPDSLNTHIKTHSSVRPYACAVENCGKAYFHSRSLRKHAKSHETLPLSMEGVEIKEEPYPARHNPYERPSRMSRSSSSDLKKSDLIFPQFTPMKIEYNYQELTSPNYINTSASTFSTLNFNTPSLSPQHEQHNTINHLSHHEQPAAGPANNPMTYHLTQEKSDHKDKTFATITNDRYQYVH